MSDTWYFFYQKEAKSSWTLSLASERDRVNKEHKPELNTVLDVNSAIDGDLAPEDKDKLKYRGPMYFDFDSEDLEEVIPAFQQFLTNLKAKGVNLNALRLYASGGKGFHIEMPPAMLMSKQPPHGTQALPLIYREVAHALFVNTLDLRVYSMGKGRQWRCPNVKRANGNHKVQITVDEAWELTPEMYADLVKYPRPLFPVEEPSFVPDLALIYAKGRDQVENGLRNRKRRKKSNDELLRFKGEWPETLRTILSGQGLKDKVGWNYLCVQLAVTADALGKTEEQLLQDAEPLLMSYAGDSGRYGTPQKRKQELRDKYRYFSGNPCYEYSVGGVLSLVVPDVATKSDLAMGEYIPDGSEGEDGEDDEDESTIRVKINANGIYSKTDLGWKNVSHMGLSDPILLQMPNGEHVGYDVDVLISGKKKGRQLMNIGALATKTSLHAYAMKFNASFRGTDMDAAHILDTMRNKVESKSRVSIVTQVEGIDVILPPDAKSPLDTEIIWSSTEGVITTGEYNFTYRPLQSAATYRSDLYNAPELTDCDEDREMINDMLKMNTPQNMARLLGWFGASFLCPILRRTYQQFPLLMVFGGATAGKSKTVALLTHLHYHLHKPKILQASGMTKFPLLSAVSSTTSIPLVLEELRPRFMTQGGMYHMVLNVLKSNYDGHDMARGALGDKGGPAVVNEFANTAPIVFTAEEQNSETAVQERSVQVCMTKGDRLGREEHYMRLLSRATNLGRLGKSMLLDVLALDIEAFKVEFNAQHMAIRTQLGKTGEGLDRPMYNLAVTLTGLKFMHSAIKRQLGNEFDEQFELMHDYVLDNIIDFVPHNMSEAAKVLDTMAQLTKTMDVQYRLEPNRDYCVNDQTRMVEIKLKPAYAKYMKYSRSLGIAPLFDSDAAFIAAMNRYEGTMQRSCPNSILFDNPFEAIFQFSMDVMEKDKIEPFKR